MDHNTLLSTFLENCAGGIALLDADGVVIYANRAAVEVLQLPLGEIEGRYGYGGMTVIPVRLDRTDMPVPETPAYRALTEDERIVGETIGIREKGSEHVRWIRVNAEPYTAKDVRYVFLSFVEVTAEVERSKQMEALVEQSTRLAERQTQFVQNTSHELRTPLTLVLGYLEMLWRDSKEKLTPVEQQSLNIALARSRHLKNILDQMLALYEAGHELHYGESLRDKFVSVNLAELVSGVVADMKLFAASAGVEVRVGTMNDSAVYGNMTLIMQAVDNLVTNAIKFTSGRDGGRVTVSVFDNKSHAVISVRDNGVGIPADKLSRIFDLFYQVDGSLTRKYPGNGLGLAVVKEVMALHHGRVEVESKHGEGSVFFLVFPFNKGDKYHD